MKWRSQGLHDLFLRCVSRGVCLFIRHAEPPQSDDRVVDDRLRLLYPGETLSIALRDERSKPMPQLDHAVISYSEARVGTGLEWKLSSIVTITGEVGYQPYRSFDYHRVGIRFENEGSSAPYGMVAVRGAF